MKCLAALLDLLYPSRCVFCRRLTQRGALICPLCRNGLPETKANAVQHFPHLRLCASPLFYVGSVRSSLLRYKFGGASHYARLYGEYLAKCVDENKISCDSITWAPLSRQRLRRRGYDQARLLAEALAGELGLPCEAMLRKKRNNRPQSSTGSAEKRRRNVENVYALQDGAAVKGKRILLVDDIVTTGATLSACAKALKTGGAAEVCAVTVARRRLT